MFLFDIYEQYRERQLSVLRSNEDRYNRTVILSSSVTRNRVIYFCFIVHFAIIPWIISPADCFVTPRTLPLLMAFLRLGHCRLLTALLHLRHYPCWCDVVTSWTWPPADCIVTPGILPLLVALLHLGHCTLIIALLHPWHYLMLMAYLHSYTVDIVLCWLHCYTPDIVPVDCIVTPYTLSMADGIVTTYYYTWALTPADGIVTTHYYTWALTPADGVVKPWIWSYTDLIVSLPLPLKFIYHVFFLCLESRVLDTVSCLWCFAFSFLAAEMAFSLSEPGMLASNSDGEGTGKALRFCLVDLPCAQHTLLETSCRLVPSAPWAPTLSETLWEPKLSDPGILSGRPVSGGSCSCPVIVLLTWVDVRDLRVIGGVDQVRSRNDWSCGMLRLWLDLFITSSPAGRSSDRWGLQQQLTKLHKLCSKVSDF